MSTLYVPVTFPFGIENGNKSVMLSANTNLFRSVLSKHTKERLKLNVSFENKTLVFDKNLKHCGIVIPSSVVSHFQSRRERHPALWTAKIEILNDVSAISKAHSAPEDIESDILNSIPVYLQGVLNIFGYARVAPLIQVDNGRFLFNPRLAHLLNPWQDWFRDTSILKIVLNSAAYKTFSKSNAKHYMVMHTHLVETVRPLNWDDVDAFKESLDSSEVFVFGRVLSELIRQHPGTDYDPMIAILTAFIEGFLCINNGENTYKFSVKIANLLRDPKVFEVSKSLYATRSKFFHSASFKTPNDIFEIVSIEFLIHIARMLFLADFLKPIDEHSLNFPS